MPCPSVPTQRISCLLSFIRQKIPMPVSIVFSGWLRSRILPLRKTIYTLDWKVHILMMFPYLFVIPDRSNRNSFPLPSTCWRYNLLSVSTMKIWLFSWNADKIGLLWNWRSSDSKLKVVLEKSGVNFFSIPEVNSK